MPSLPKASQALPLSERCFKRLPWPLQRWIASHRQCLEDRRQVDQDSERVFGRIYQQRIWDPAGSVDFHSGLGSHDDAVVQPYVAALRDFLRSLPARPAVVDLGCGDFNVGAQLRAGCGRYIACDVVGPLIERNQRMFAALDVDFRQLDIVAEPLPAGDLVFLRQVLQHLNNAQIAQVVGRLAAFKFVVLTEHLPAAKDFEPNVDKPTGHGIRVGRLPPSGVVLTAAPFHLAPWSATRITSVPSEGGRIDTVVYRMRP